jgi:hypothetical protein
MIEYTQVHGMDSVELDFAGFIEKVCIYKIRSMTQNVGVIKHLRRNTILYVFRCATYVTK